MATDRDFYSILQVNQGATAEAIDRAYDRLAKVYDPVTSKKPRAAARMAEIDEAYAVLGDRVRRAEYDRRGRAGWQKAGASAGGGVQKVFSVAFGNPFALAGLVSIGAVAALVVLVVISAVSGGDEEAVTALTATPVVSVSTEPIASGTPGPSGTPFVRATSVPNPPAIEGEEVTLESGLKYIDIVEGTGRSPVKGQRLIVDYTGWLADTGAKFDSSLDRDVTFNFIFRTDDPGGGVIEGWYQGTETMKVGGTRRLIIPPELAYGEAGRSGIPGNATLIFDIILLDVRDV